MRDGLGPGRSRGMTLALVSAIASLVLSGCVAASAPPSGRDAATGFPFACTTRAGAVRPGDAPYALPRLAIGRLEAGAFERLLAGHA